MSLSNNWRDYMELVGILAILIGLFFVQREIQLNSTIARAELSAETSRNLSQLDEMIISGEISELWSKSLQTPGDLTFTERLRLNVFLENVLIQYNRECYYEEIEIFEECESVPRDTAVKYFSSEYGRAFWDTVRNRMVGPRITSLVDAALATDPSTMVWIQLDNQVIENLSN